MPNFKPNFSPNKPKMYEGKSSSARKPPARLLARNALLLNPNKPSMRAAGINIPHSANSILDMIQKLPSRVVQQIYKGLEGMQADQLDMLGKKKYPGE